MIAQYGKRALSLLLALVMIFSMVPFQVFAEEAHDHSQEEEITAPETTATEPVDAETENTDPVLTEPVDAETENTDPALTEPAVSESENVDSALALELTNRVNAIVDDYGIHGDMTEDEIFEAMYEKSDEELIATMEEMDALSEASASASKADEEYVLAHADLQAYGKLCEAMDQLREIALFAASGNHTPVAGVSVSVSGATDNSMSNGAVTVTAKGSGGIFGIGASTKTATITIGNDSGSKAKLSFNWTATSVNQLKIDGTEYSGSSGSFEKVMEAGETLTVTITTAKNSTTNKLVMSGFTIVAVKESSAVTFQYDSTLGSITVAGNAVAPDGQVDVPSAGAALVATPASGVAFLGWIDADTHVLLSGTASYTLEPAADMNVQAVFTKGDAWFLVNGNALYGDLNEAVAAAGQISNKTIVLANNGTLPAGDYTIPSGITLLIPYDSVNTLCTTAPTTSEASSFTAPTVYRKLTMAEGANITINGALSLSATQKSGGGQSSPIGACSFIQMEPGSSITVNNGGKLYAWGYIQGSGSVTVKSGGTVYECFQLMDWRGGDNTSSMIGNSKRVFPMSQYYVQNIEVPMTLEAGATENGYMSVQITLVGIQGSTVPFIGSNGMFNITSGYIVKDYDESTGRLLIDMHGALSVKSLSLSMNLGLLIGKKTINSKDYILPINGNMTVTMHSGSTVAMTQDIALQPGARLIVEEGATCTLGNGNKIYVYDYDQWIMDSGNQYDEGKSFCGTSDKPYINLQYPTSATKVQGRDQDAYVEINGTVDISNGYVYTTSSGASICGTGTLIMKPGTETVTYQVKCLGSDGKSVTYFDVPITSAQLMNADGSYVSTADDKGVVIYKSVNGNWTCEHTYAEGTYSESVTTAATCEGTGVKTITCNCGEDSYTVEIPALGHTYEAVVTAPTCTAAGYTTHTCKNGCGSSYTDSETAALGHTDEVIPAVAPDCVNTGLTEGKKCSVCGEILAAQEEVDALGHTDEILPAVAPDCVNTGLTEGKKCSVCGETLVAQEVVDALGHTDEVIPAVAPDCVNTGLSEGKKCSVCGEILLAQEVVDALDHAWEWVTDQEATVLNPGVKHEECSRCHEKRNENTEIPVLVCAHTGTMSGTEAKDATCTEAGNSAYWYCSACRNYYSDAAGQHEIAEGSWVIGALGHNDVAHEAKAPTCTEIGWDAYVTCSRCDYTTYEEKASLGHDEVAHEAKAPTCTEIGWDAYVTCSRCDYTTYVEISAAGHGELEEVAAVASTCQKEGIVAHWHCPDCGMNFADAAGSNVLESVAAPINPDNHTWADEGEETKATCTAEGKVVYACVNEGCEETKVDTLPVDPEGHIWNEGEGYKNHSCNSDGMMKYTCTLCEEEKLVVIREQHFRVPIAEEIPATCTEDGMTSGWKCEKCDEFWIPQEVIPALGHDWNGNLPCQSDASACTRCDLHFDSKQEHLVIVDEGIPATCTEPGLTEGAHCGYCGEILVAQTEIPVAEHNWIVADMEIPATCGAAGHKEGASYCLDCNYDADPIPMLEHEWIHREAKKATYSAIGWNAHDYCLLCKVTKTAEQYETAPCEFCGDNHEGYMEIPKVEVQKIATVDEFLTNIGYLEMMAAQYAVEHPGADPLALVLNYMRTAVENYTSGSWAIMAGPEDKDFLKYVQEMEDAINSAPDIDVWVNVSGLKKLGTFTSPSNETNRYASRKVGMLSGHFFGTMDMTYHNKGSQNHADVGGWVGDLTDLLSTADEYGVGANLTLEEKIAYITQKYLFKEDVAGSAGSFGSSDLYADLDAYYFMNELITKGYNTGDLEKMMREYYQPGLTLEKRVSYLLTNRLDGLSTRQDLRTAVYNAYTSNKLIATLEGTRNFNATGSELTELRKAVCYAFADEMCRIAGDYVDDLTNPRFTVFDSETKILAPGISQQINYATNADGKQIVYYVATADVNRDDVGLWVNYYDRDPGTPENPVWKNNSVPSSAQNAQDRYGDPASEDYIENFNVIASTNAGGYSMQEDATPGGLMVMNGIEWYPNTGSAGFFAILDDGTAYMGTHDEYEAMKDQIQEAIGGFGEFVVKDGKVVGSATYSDAPRTSVGITSTGRVVIMCIDGRQAPFSSGASLQDVGYIMKEAGCVVAINLDGGGSTTFVARQPGSDELTVMNRPSDGYPRNVSSNLLIYSTAPSSTAFDHAVIESEYDYATIGTPVQMTAAGVSPSGNAVDVPEGATWAVSDENWGTITEDGVFTGKRLGEVTVYLMLDGKEVGSKLMTITNPDQLYFEKAKVDAIYGSSVKLPLRARYEGKAIAINPNDVTFALSAPAAGTMDGFTFRVAESTIKTLSITASVGENIQASINVMLYKQGENSFDFEKATGGDRTFAWDRQVSNAKLEDGNIYNVIDPSQDMVTSYIFALDMTSIPIPERLEELTYMLPGGTMEGANAWSFLLSLAQRISDLTWVQATVDFDDRFVVDYSNLTVLNDYFELTSTEFDETTNTLTVTLNWIKQSQVIDEATANPLCLINGLKLTPKEGVWEEASKINAVTSGTIGYEIYMRASGLYSFAQKPESQAVFGLYPYRNPADTSDAGGYFRDTYAEVTDEYTLVNVLKEGWVNEDGGFAYYVNGERLTGVQKVEGFYYDFGTEGINVGQTKLSGIFFDEVDKVYRYSYQGVLTTGWQMLGGDWYYFRPSTMAAIPGTAKIGGVSYEFEENGKLVSGVWVNTLGGLRYYYGPSYHEKWWIEIDGKLYYFRNGYLLTGIQEVRELENASLRKWYDFGEDGACRGVVEDGLLTKDGDIYYIVDGYKQMGLHCVDGDYYFFTYDGPAVTSCEKYAWETHCDLPCGNYAFGEDGKMANGLVQMSDGIYYYFNGKIKTNAAGITKIGTDYYFVSSIGRVATGKYFCWATNCDLPVGEYEFGPDGKMLQGVVQKDDGVYFYVNGRFNGNNAGLTKIDGDYYFVASNGKCAVNRIYSCWATNCDLPVGEYEFGPDGKMLQGIVQKDDGVYYYVNGRFSSDYAGLTNVDGDYYFVASNGKCAVNRVYYCWATNCDLPVGEYEFGPDGKMLQGIVQKDDGTYYYTNGKKGGAAAGLTKVGSDYYFVASNGRCATGSYSCWATNCDLPLGVYEFGPDGKMLHGLIEKEDGLYSYVYGKLGGNPGLIKLDDGYYFVASNGKVATGTYSCWKTLCDLPTGTYEFGSDGKMYDGFVTKDDGIYYYDNGKLGRVGLNYIDGYYYFVANNGKLVTNRDFYVWETNGLLLETTYTFNELGQIVK